MRGESSPPVHGGGGGAAAASMSSSPAISVWVSVPILAAGRACRGAPIASPAAKTAQKDAANATNARPLFERASMRTPRRSCRRRVRAPDVRSLRPGLPAVAFVPRKSARAGWGSAPTPSVAKPERSFRKERRPESTNLAWTTRPTRATTLARSVIVSGDKQRQQRLPSKRGSRASRRRMSPR